jgi:Protein of unknown function (DUF2281)
MSIEQTILEKLRQLPPDKQQEILDFTEFLHQRSTLPSASQKPKWQMVCGQAPYPLAGEDAQNWVSRTRQDGDNHREQALRQAR